MARHLRAWLTLFALVVVAWDWTSPAAPSAFRVYVDGQLFAAVDGSARTADLGDLPVGPHRIVVASVSSNDYESLHTAFVDYGGSVADLPLGEPTGLKFSR